MTRGLGLALVGLLMAGAAMAQDTTTAGDQTTDPAATTDSGASTLPEVNNPPDEYDSAKGATLRLLDKLTGKTVDLDMKAGVAQTDGKLGLVLDDCRYPKSNATSEAYAHLTITEAGVDKPLFQGWMIASSPALSALDHPRYDVWVLVCDVPDALKPKVDSTAADDGSGG